MSPPVITVPAGIPIQLTIISGDGRRHLAVLAAPTERTLRIPAHGRASVLMSGLHAGHYTLDVDGTARGTLAIGGAPGP